MICCGLAAPTLLRVRFSLIFEELPAEASRLAPERVLWACAPDVGPFGGAYAVLKIGFLLGFCRFCFVPNFFVLPAEAP